MVYGRSDVFDADRLIDLLTALEDYSVASKSARGDLDLADLSRPLGGLLPSVSCATVRRHWRTQRSNVELGTRVSSTCQKG